MQKIALFLLVAATRAALPDPPKVTVPPRLLKEWGVTIDPNKPGIFDKLINNATAGKKVQELRQPAAVAQIRVLVDVDQFSGKQFVQFMEKLPFGLEEHGQFAVAHIMNVYFRMYNFTEQFQKNVTDSIRKYGQAQNRQPRQLCRNDVFIQAIARQYTMDFNSDSACNAFEALLSKDLILRKKLSDIQFSEQTLKRLDGLLDEPTTTLGDIKMFLYTAPYLPNIFQRTYRDRMVESFRDYIQFINQIERSHEGQRELMTVLRHVRPVIESQMRSFWDMSSMLEG